MLLLMCYVVCFLISFFKFQKHFYSYAKKLRRLLCCCWCCWRKWKCSIYKSIILSVLSMWWEWGADGMSLMDYPQWRRVEIDWRIFSLYGWHERTYLMVKPLTVMLSWWDASRNKDKPSPTVWSLWLSL